MEAGNTPAPAGSTTAEPTAAGASCSDRVFAETHSLALQLTSGAVVSMLQDLLAAWMQSKTSTTLVLHGLTGQQRDLLLDLVLRLYPKDLTYQTMHEVRLQAGGVAMRLMKVDHYKIMVLWALRSHAVPQSLTERLLRPAFDDWRLNESQCKLDRAERRRPRCARCGASSALLPLKWTEFGDDMCSRCSAAVALALDSDEEDACLW